MTAPAADGLGRRTYRFRPAAPGAPEIAVTPDPFRRPMISVDGRVIGVRRERGRPFYPIPMADGSEAPLTVYGSLLGLRARFEGREYPVERRLTWLELFLVILPIAALTIAASRSAIVIGIGLAVAGYVINVVIVKSALPGPARIGLAILVALAAIAVALVAPSL